MIKLGLTGSIGMGKSTTAQMFAALGLPVIDADRIVHDLYRGEARAPVEAAFPGTVVDGVVDRARLAERLAADPGAFKQLEAIVHPLVHQRERELLQIADAEGKDIVVLDIPLLFENNGEGRVDKVVVVTCDADIQRRRVLERPGMTEAKFEMILSRQMPDAEKRARADFIVDTGKGMDAARAAVAKIVETLRHPIANQER